MKETVSLADIKVQNVGATCITLVSKFGRVIKDTHGVTIQLRDNQVLNKVAAYAAASGSPELKLINAKIEQEVRQYLARTSMNYDDAIVLTHQPLLTKEKNKAKVYRRI